MPFSRANSRSPSRPAGLHASRSSACRGGLPRAKFASGCACGFRRSPPDETGRTRGRLVRSVPGDSPNGTPRDDAVPSWSGCGPKGRRFDSSRPDQSYALSRPGSDRLLPGHDDATSDGQGDGRGREEDARLSSRGHLNRLIGYSAPQKRAPATFGWGLLSTYTRPPRREAWPGTGSHYFSMWTMIGLMTPCRSPAAAWTRAALDTERAPA